MNRLVRLTESDRARKTFYPTPEALAEKLLRDVDWRKVESILEPSAGKGDLARYCAGQIYYSHYRRRAHDSWTWDEALKNADIDCIEIDPALRNTLEGNGFRVVHDDFLTYETQKRYHLVVMNPPFDDGAAHLLGGDLQAESVGADAARRGYLLHLERGNAAKQLHGAEAGAGSEAERVRCRD